jgi:hypothetical protein
VGDGAGALLAEDAQGRLQDERAAGLAARRPAGGGGGHLVRARQVQADDARDDQRERAELGGGDRLAERARTDLAGALTDLLAADLADSRTSLLAAYSLWIEAARRPSLRGIEQEWTHAYVAVVEGVLRDAGSPHPQTDAELLVATLDGLLLAQLALDHPDPAVALRPQLERLVGALLRAP